MRLPSGASQKFATKVHDHSLTLVARKRVENTEPRASASGSHKHTNIGNVFPGHDTSGYTGKNAVSPDAVGGVRYRSLRGAGGLRAGPDARSDN